VAEPRIPPEALQQVWVHSHEEDTETEMVFRPAGHRFPPSRGRRSFELREGGQLIEGAPGAADRRAEARGAWRLTEDGALAFARQPGAPPHRVLRIVSAAPDRLVVQKGS
jgi:hypothetical protein